VLLLLSSLQLYRAANLILIEYLIVCIFFFYIIFTKVGKTAIAEGIAQRMVAGDVPDTLQGCKLIGLDLAALVAGASMRGEFEERLKSVLEEVQQSEGEIILFKRSLKLL